MDAVELRLLELSEAWVKRGDAVARDEYRALHAIWLMTR